MKEPSETPQVRIVIGPPRGPHERGLEPPMRVAISQAEQDHFAAMRRRSYGLAIARGHIRR